MKVINSFLNLIFSIGEVGSRVPRCSKDIKRAKSAASKQLFFGLLLNVPLYISAIFLAYALYTFDIEWPMVIAAVSCFIIATINALKNTLDHILQTIIVISATVMDEASWPEFVKAIESSKDKETK